MKLLGLLGLQDSDNLQMLEENKYKYNYSLGSIYFLNYPLFNKLEFFNSHSEIWSENDTEFFICEIGDRVHICDSKTKPNYDNPLENVEIDSFTYGTNQRKVDKYLELLKKDNIDYGYCLRELIESVTIRENGMLLQDT